MVVMPFIKYLSAVFLAQSFVFMQLCINCINWIKKLILLQPFLLDRLAFASSVDTLFIFK